MNSTTPRTETDYIVPPSVPDVEIQWIQDESLREGIDAANIGDVEKLIEFLERPERTRSDINRFLNYITLSGMNDVVKTIYDKFGYEQTKDQIQTPLMVAAANGNKELVELFSDQMHIRDARGESAYDYALNGGAPMELVRMLRDRVGPAVPK